MSRLAIEEREPKLGEKVDALTGVITDKTSAAMIASATREGVLPR